jgi:hypothetical protein
MSDTTEWEHDDIPPPPPRLEQPRNAGNHMFMSPRNQRERDVWAAERWTKNGWTFEQIAEALEVAGRSRAYLYVKRGLAITGAPVEAAAAEARAIHRARLEMATEAALQVLENPHVTVSNGQIIRVDGKPLPDDGPVLAAIDRIVKISESLRKLDGIDAATKVDANITVNPQDIELAQIIRQTEEANEAQVALIKGENADD